MSEMNRMIQVVGNAGSMAVGNAPLGEVAQEWIDAGFSDVEAARWLESRCYDAAAAAKLAKAGVTPEQASAEAPGGETIGYAVANGDMTVREAVATRVSDMLARVSRLVGDDGTGDLGVIVRQALSDDPTTTADAIAEIVAEARRDARIEAEREAE